MVKVKRRTQSSRKPRPASRSKRRPHGPRDLRGVPTAELWALRPRSNNELATRYQPLVRQIAEVLALKTPPEVDVDDLASDGFFGLMQAIKRYDPKTGYKFGTFASRRIRGSILDAIRLLDFVPRLERSMMQCQECGNRQKKPKGRCDKCGSDAWLPTDKAKMTERSTVERDITSMSHHQASATFTLHPMAKDENLIAVETRDAIDRLLGGLQNHHRSCMKLYFLDGLTMKEVGHSIGMSESRVSQIISESKKQLRSSFSRPEDLQRIGLVMPRRPQLAAA